MNYSIQTMQALFFSLLALVAVCFAADHAPSQQPQPSAIRETLRNLEKDPCFINLSDATASRNATSLTRMICPETECGPKYDDYVKLLVTSGDNRLALFGHFFTFQRELACAKPTTTTGQEMPTCAEEIVRATNRASVSRYFSMFGWERQEVDLRSHHEHLLFTFNTPFDKHDIVRDVICNQDHCLHKYLSQWYAWIKAVPKQYIEQIRYTPFENEFAPSELEGAASRLYRHMFADCRALGRPPKSTDEIKLEVDMHFSHQVVPLSSGAVSIQARVVAAVVGVALALFLPASV